MKPWTWRRRISDRDLDRALDASYRHAVPAQKDAHKELDRIMGPGRRDSPHQAQPG